MGIAGDSLGVRLLDTFSRLETHLEVEAVRSIRQKPAVLPVPRRILNLERLEERLLLSGATIYVDDDFTPATEGWAVDHFDRIQDGINAAGAGDTVMVAEGTYYENITLDSGHNGLTLQGAGADVTIIDGGGSGSVIDLNDFDGGTINGFTIRNGSASEGGGINCDSSDSIITSCVITGNVADLNGGGVYVAGGSPTILNNVLTDNTALFGAAFYMNGTSPTFANNTIWGNTAGSCGGALYGTESAFTMFNCILWNNESSPLFPNDEIMLRSDAYLTIRYSIIMDGDDEIYAWMGGDYSYDSTNSESNPRFVAADLGDFHLQATSPAIDAANGDAAPATDFEANPRIDDPLTANRGVGTPDYADIGAFEFVSVTDNDPPTIASLEGAPDPVTEGDVLSLTAGGVSDPDGNVVSVSFYRDANSDGEGQAGELLGTDTDGSDGWSWSGAVTWWAGTHTYLAKATDDGSPALDSSWASVSGEVVADVDVVRIRLEAADLLGNPVSSVAVGDDFQLQVYVEDLRTEPDGVFAAYLDVFYTSQASVNGAITYGAEYPNGQWGDTGTPGVVDEVGASDGFTPLGGGEFLLCSIPFEAVSAGTVSFTADPAEESPSHDVLVFGSNDPVPKSSIDYVGDTLTVNAPLELIQSHADTDGVIVSIYDVDPSDGISAPDIAWSPDDYVPGVTDVLVDPGPVGDGIISMVILYGDGTQTADLGFVLEDDPDSVGGDYVGLGKFLDERTGTPPVGFLVSQGPVPTVQATAGIAGADLNGFTTEGGWVLPDDIDGDGQSDDLTGLYTLGYVNRLTARGDIGGDVVVGGELGVLRVVGGDLNGDVVLTGSDIGRVVARAVYDDVAHEWVGGNLRGTVRTPGDADVVGAVGGNMEGLIEIGGSMGLTGALAQDGQGGNVSGSVVVGGDLDRLRVEADLSGDATVGGYLRRIAVDGSALGSTLCAGSMRLLSVLGNVNNARIEVEDLLQSVQVTGDFWNSSIDAGELGRVLVEGQITEDDSDGDIDEIHADAGSFLVRDVDEQDTITPSYDHWFDGVRAWVG